MNRKQSSQQNPLFSDMKPLPQATQKQTHAAQTKNKIKTPEKKGRAHAAPHRIIHTSAYDEIYSNLVKNLKAYFEKQNFKRGVLGLSGGVDSSLTLKIAVDALGPANVAALIMPELGVTKQENIDHAKILCKFFNVRFYYQPINNFLTDFNIVHWKPNELAKMNTKARVRTVLLYNFANTENALVLGTSNRSELLLGYGTKFGDFAADVEVLGSLFKTDVVALADFIGLPPEIVNKTPSAELALGQTDEEELGATYKELDRILSKLDLGPQGCVEHGLPAPTVQLVFRRLQENKHKTELPFVIKTQ